jgi:hypothetical protein
MRHNQNRRSRGRSRKGPSPLSRSYESNGPDVKVRGTAAHVAEKYMSLARDAQASGDIVAAENYLQHAEHYNRIVMAAQAQFQPPQPQYRDGPDEGYDDEGQVNGRSRDRFEYGGEGMRGGEDEGGERDRFAYPQDDEQPSYQPREYRPDDRDRQRETRGDDRRDARGEDRDRRDSRGDDRHRQRDFRRDRYERRDRPDYGNGGAVERPETVEAPAAPAMASEPQPEVTMPAASEMAAEQSAPPPRRRRSRSNRSEAGPESAPGAEEPTRDGEAALAAFPE